MLVFISDLHLRDEVFYSINKKATEGFLTQNLIPQVRQANAKELIVVFLGDLVDINRSRYWVDGNSRSKKNSNYTYKPWSHWYQTLGNIMPRSISADGDFDEKEFELHVLSVLKRIRQANQQDNGHNYDLWRRLKSGDKELWKDIQPPATIRYEFIPGNHDRLAQYTREIRAALIKDFSLDHDASIPFPWVKEYADYSVVAFHGHILDPHNFGGGEIPENPVSSPWYEFPSLGDVVTVNFGVKLVHQFSSDPILKPYSNLEPSLGQIDLVRPQSAVLRWLAQWGLYQSRELKSKLDDMVVRILSEFRNEPFVNWWISHRLSQWQRLLLRLADLFGLLRPKSIEDGFRIFERLSGGGRTLEDYSNTMKERLTRSPFTQWLKESYPCARCLVSGHTHRPLILPLQGRIGDDAREEKVYFNTGTWLDVIDGVEGDGFTRRNQIVHATFYRDGEDIKGKKRSYWEYWQGNLREGPL